MNISLKRKPKAPKKELSHEAKIWKRMEQPIWGMFGFTILPFIIIGLDYATRPVADLPVFLDVVSDWQGLVAGSFALLAAAFAARAVMLQISSAETAELTRQKDARSLDERNTARDLLAARSVMPLTLNVLGDYATAIAMSAHEVLRTTAERRVETDQMPPLAKAPASIIADLQAFIRAAPAEAGSAVADVLSDIQLLSANAESTWQRTVAGGGEIVMRQDFEALIGRAAVLHARIAGLFPYARRSVEAPPTAPLPVHVDYALRLWVVVPESYPGYVSAAQAYLNAAVVPAP